MSIPSYQQWMDDTSAGILKPRSAKLKAVDEAIQQYEKTRSERDLWRIKNAFEDWKRYKGFAWQASERNRKGAARKLDEELNRLADYRMYQITHFSMDELVAFSVVGKERKNVIGNIFAGKEVTLKAAKLKDQVKELGPKIKEASEKAVAHMKSIGKKDAPKAAGPDLRQKMEDMAKKFFSVDSLDALGSVGSLVISILGQCAVSVPPVVGHIKDGYDLFTGWTKVGVDLYAEYNIAQRKYTIDIGTPSAAFGALQECLKDETKNEAISATRATASFAAKTGLVFVDGGAISGPVIGAVNALADFSHKIYLLSVEYKSTKAINEKIKGGELDIRLFRTYPLMGCYLLVSATLSDLIPIESFGTPGWMDYIENLKRHSFDDIYKSATDLIDKSPWEMNVPKRPQKGSGGIFSEVKRVFSTVSPLADLKELGDLPH